MDIKALTFDYFGTLVDVDKGGMEGIAEVMRILGVTSSRPVFDVYLDWDTRNVQTYRASTYRSYRAVAQDALAACIDALFPNALAGHDIEALTDVLLAHLVESSPPHADALEFLDWAGPRYPLMPITNMDSDLWRRSQLARYFEHVTTAEMAKAYKPSHLIFSLALDRLGLDAHNVLHCSLASWADIDGAKPLGMHVAWINRSADKLGPWQPRPDFEFTALSPVREVLTQSQSAKLGELK
ncbi:hydrolase [Burkholderia latens]|uniref:Hydrolase n=1 Tax=Burkholderia latens TaxID=488446 RepID=A0AAP1C8J6_9BURK|nr:HAD family hydrolase [Burkholderia latens]AIO38433.1 haloacid dehalogenase-like hydrolase family protein [Burkholderia cenocepacia]KVA04266.1 hydrolase [Burkholderia latens]